MAGKLVVAFWNRRKEANAEAQVEWLRHRDCCRPWDVLILAEVKSRSLSTFGELGAHVWAWPAVEDVSQGPNAHGVVIVSRYQLTNLDRPTPPAVAPASVAPDLASYVSQRGHRVEPRPLLPERWLAADVSVPGGPPVRVAGFHAPYAAGSTLEQTVVNRLAKRQAYQQVAAWAAEQPSDVPLVIGMDGNNWYDWRDGSDIVERKGVRRRNPLLRHLDDADLFDAEHEFHGPEPSHGLVDTLRAAVVAGDVRDEHGSIRAAEGLPSTPLALTYRRKNDGDRMDRVYASPAARVTAAGVCHGPLGGEVLVRATKGTKLAPGSDHALVWAELAL